MNIRSDFLARRRGACVELVKKNQSAEAFIGKKFSSHCGNVRYCNKCGLRIPWKTRARHCKDCLVLVRESRKHWQVYKKLAESNKRYEAVIKKSRANGWKDKIEG
jgi:hypothetical protein